MTNYSVKIEINLVKLLLFRCEKASKKKGLSFKILPEFLNVISGPKFYSDKQKLKKSYVSMCCTGSANKY